MENGKEDFTGKVDGKGYKGSMDDDRKVPLTLVWPGFIRGVARVLRFGMRKYSRGNWMRGMSFSEVIDAMKRHIEAIERGEDIDPDSGEPHVDHIGCNAMFLDYYMNGPDAAKYKQFDDRLYKPVVEDAPTPPDAQGVPDPWKVFSILRAPLISTVGAPSINSVTPSFQDHTQGVYDPDEILRCAETGNLFKRKYLEHDTTGQFFVCDYLDCPVCEIVRGTRL